MKHKLICLHGFWGGPHDFDLFTNELNAIEGNEFKVEAQNLYANKVYEELSIQQAAKYWLDCNLEPDQDLNVLGYSMGGRLALEAFKLKPDQFNKLILLGVHPGNLSTKDKLEKAKFDNHWIKLIESSPLEEVWQSWNELELFCGTQKVQNMGVSKLQLIQGLQGWSTSNQALDWGDMGPYLHKISWICGEKDHKYLKLYKNLAEQRLIQEFISISGAGHRVALTHPKALASEVVKSLDCG